MKRVKGFFPDIFGRFLHYVKEFTEISTLHGLKYVSMSDSHYLEILLWFVVLTLSVFGAGTLIGASYQHYNENPTVIAMQKNYKEWNITFPASTFCFINNLDPERAKAFIETKWRVKPGPGDENLGSRESNTEINIEKSPNDVEEFYNDDNSTSSGTSTESVQVSTEDPKPSKFRYYFYFLQDLVNQTYDNMKVFEKYVDDDTLRNLKIKNTVLEVIREHTMRSTFYTKEFNNTEFYLTPTEMGMCYVHGGKLADFITLGGNPKVRRDFELPMCNYMNTLCYARTEGTPDDVRYYIHSPYEIPDSSDPFFLVRGRVDRDVALSSLETTVSDEIYKLNPFQRHCRFMEEPTVSHLRVYSFNLCRMQCRKELAFQFCRCAPYFYTKESRIPVCGVKGLACLSKYKETLITLRNSTTNEKLTCDCLPQCIDNQYTVDKEIIRSWEFPVPYDIRFRWAIEKFSKIRLRRNVIYTFEDLVVSFGGIAAFFLGCSVLSFVEIVYFFSLRLLWYVRSSSRVRHVDKNSKSESTS